MAFNKELFINSLDQVPNHFIKLTSLDTIVSNTVAIENMPIFFKKSTNINQNQQYMNRNQEKLNIYQYLSDDFILESIKKIMNIINVEFTIAKKTLIVNSFNLEKSVDFILRYQSDSLSEVIEKYSYNLLDFKNNCLKIATFFDTYNYTNGLKKLLNDDLNNTFFKLLISFNNCEADNYFNMCINVFICKKYLQNIYDCESIPRFLFKIIIDKHNKSYSDNCLKVNSTIFNQEKNLVFNDYKRPLYDHQINNIIWMKNLENQIKNNLISLKTFINNNSYNIFKIPEINDYLVADRCGKVYNYENLEQIYIIPRGGVLCDDIGIGKSFSFIGLIKENLSESSNLIVCPTRLCKQWSEEIIQSTNLSFFIISTIVQFKKFISLKKKNKVFNIIILSYNFLINKNYIEFKFNNKDDQTFFIENIIWERVILDEGHEYFDNLKLKKIYYQQVKKSLDQLNFNYIWICSGTPFNNYTSLMNLIFFICQINCPDDYSIKKNMAYIQHFGQELINQLFIKNTKHSIINTVKIPDPIITTDFLDQTDIEKAIYQSALGNKNKMIQLCSHIIVSEDHLCILGNNPLPFDEIQLKMKNYYHDKVQKIEQNLSNLEIKITGIDQKIDKTNDKITEENNNLTFNIQLKENQTFWESSGDTLSEIDNKITDSHQKIDNYQIRLKDYEQKIQQYIEKKKNYQQDHQDNLSKTKIFQELDIKLKQESECPICYNDLKSNIKVILKCGHFFCSSCIAKVLKNNEKENCPFCRQTFLKTELNIVKPNLEQNQQINKWGTKMSYLINYLKEILENNNNRIIIFSQWDNLLKLVGTVLIEHSISHLFLNGSIHTVNGRIRKFKLDQSIRIALLSSEKAASGLTLTEANHIILLDTLNTDKETSQIIEQQAIGRAVRIGQTQNVQVKRLIMNDTIEYDFYQQNIENKRIKII